MEKAQFFQVHFVYEASEEVHPTLSPDKGLASDLGLDNLAPCVNSTDRSSVIIDGKKLKFLNPQYQVRMAKLQSILDL